jgi:hypothetical protein
MAPSDKFQPSLYFKLGSGGSYSMQADINNPNPAFWDASPQGYNGDIGQSALFSAAMGYNYSKRISTDFEFIYHPSFNYTKYQTSTATNTIFFNGDKTRYFNLESDSIMWNMYFHGKGYSDALTYQVHNNIFVEPFIGGGIGAAFNTVSNFHSIKLSVMSPCTVLAHPSDEMVDFKQLHYLIRFLQCFNCSIQLIFSTVTFAITSKASCVRKPWWLVITTLGNVVNRIKISSWIISRE